MKKLITPILAALLFIAAFTIPISAEDNYVYSNDCVDILDGVRVNASFAYLVADNSYVTLILNNGQGTLSSNANSYCSVSHTMYIGYSNSRYSGASSNNKLANATSGSKTLSSAISGRNTTSGSYMYISVKKANTTSSVSFRASYKTTDMSIVAPVGVEVINPVVKDIRDHFKTLLAGLAVTIAAIISQPFFTNLMTIFGIIIALAVASAVIIIFIRRFKHV